MEARDYLAVLRKRWLTVASAATLALGVTYGVTLATTPLYESSTRLFFAVPGGESVTDLAQGSSFTEKQMSSYSQVATSPLVLDSVIEQLSLQQTAQELAQALKATVPPGTVILEISASSPDAPEAKAVANAVGTRLAEVVADLYPSRVDGTPAVRATTLSRASEASAPSQPNLAKNLAFGLMVGSILGVAWALVREAMDTKLRTQRDVQLVTNKAILGSVSQDPEAASDPIAIVANPSSPRAEEIRRLRTNLQFVDVENASRAFLVTSSIPAEGKTTTAANLAVALSDAGARVLLMDADLRRPSLAPTLGLSGAAGLTSILIGSATADEVIQPWLGGRIDVLASGPVPPNPSELLGSAAMGRLLSQLKSTYEVVIVDSPPLLPVTDAAILSKLVDGTIIVVGAEQTHRAQLRSAIQALDAVGASVSGIVLNKLAARDQENYASSYTYESRAGAHPRARERAR